ELAALWEPRSDRLSVSGAGHCDPAEPDGVAGPERQRPEDHGRLLGHAGPAGHVDRPLAALRRHVEREPQGRGPVRPPRVRGQRHLPEQSSQADRDLQELSAMLSVKPTTGGRAGFTLVELIITLVLVSFVAGAIVKLLLRQQRFYNSTTELIETRQQIRQAAAMLPSDLRGISSIGGDIYVMTDSSLEFRSVFGSSIVCVNTGGKLS